MKPLPAQDHADVESSDRVTQSLASDLATTAASHSASNRRASTSRVPRLYPWLLGASTALAALFCVMYITKPFIGTQRDLSPLDPATPLAARTLSATSPQPHLMPSHDRLPGEKSPTEPPQDPATSSSPTPEPVAFEQTNLRIQHILTAEAPGGHQSRINLDVPVLYQSRSLRWTASEVAEARALLARLSDYQEKSLTLRTEGAELLDAWSRLIGSSIPVGDLRADSPTLPANQEDSVDAPRAAGLDTRELIQIQPAGK